MSDNFLGEIRMFAGNFAPVGSALCNGQIMPIAQNTALFSLLGTTYGGNGTSNFALPNMQDRTPMAFGNGAGLTPRVLGEIGGSSNVTLISTEIPQHNHTALASSSAGTDSNPANEVFGTNGRGRPQLYSGTAPSVQMAPTTVTGGSLPHNNRQPYQCVTFFIALQGIFPARN